MTNKDYWARRAQDRMERYMEAAEDSSKSLSAAYKKTADYISAEAARVEKNFINAFKLSETEARRLIDGANQGKNMAQTLGSALSGITEKAARLEAEAQLSSAAYAYRIKRLEDLSNSIKDICDDLTKTTLAVFDKQLSKIANEAYLQGVLAGQKQTGVSSAFNIVPKSRINEILKENWSGEHFSKRIWGNVKDMEHKLKNSLLVGIMSGQSENKMTQDIMQRCAVGAYEARRLVRTETNAVANRAEVEGYKEAGIEKYEFSACIDGRTSKLCEELDGKIFKLSEAKQGVNMPPMHPWCRSTTLAVLPDEDELDKELAELGEEIGADLGFDEWKEHLEEQPDGRMLYKNGVDNSGESGIINFNVGNSAFKPITDEAIENVKVLNVTDDEALNSKHQKECQNLLRQLQDKEVGLEMSIVLDENMERIDGFDYVVGDIGRTAIDKPNIKHHAIHNHGSGETFSYNDLQQFASDNNMLSLTAQGNDGRSYCVSMTEKTDRRGYSVFMYGKGKETIFSFNGIDFTNDFIRDNSEECRRIIGKMSEEEKSEFMDRLKNFNDECAKGSEKYGFRYSKT